ncbi:MAG: ribosome biogenesis GTPase YlqF [Selenomonadaceae bacterium]|nr:ribosome biogenesis GTPase YlqF [Selenomonadaceae bacterium]
MRLAESGKFQSFSVIIKKIFKGGIFLDEINLPELQWFPGHMKKAERLIQENLKSVDLVLEVLDARIPFSSQNPLLKKLLGGKKNLKVLAKADLADENKTQEWIKHFQENNFSAVAVDASKGTGIKNLISTAKKLAEEKTHKLAKYGAKPRSARAMVIGIPNVGKSSLINKLAGMNHTKIENRPGVTRAKQWIKISDGLDLLDTPGILYPKFDDKKVALKLAWTFAINDETYDVESVVYLLIETLAEKIPDKLSERYKISTLPNNSQEILSEIGKKRGCLKRGGEVDMEKTARIFLNEFRAGKIGRITLDEI